MEIPIVSKSTKYIIVGVIFIAITFFIGRCSKPDVDITLWEAERQEILLREMQRQDSLMIMIGKREKHIVLLERKDSVSKSTIGRLESRSKLEARYYQITIEGLRKLSTSVLQDTIYYEYEKYH